MKNILVPTDFSAASQNATEYAVSLAKSFNATVHLLNVVSTPVVLDDSILAFVMSTQAELVEANKKLMEKEIDTLSKEGHVIIKGMVKEGYAVDEIPELAKAISADLIVMGMKGNGKSMSLFGSTTTTIIRKSDYPVFVIPENAFFKPIDHIAFASDFDTGIKVESYSMLMTIAARFNSHINVLNVQKNASSMRKDELPGKMKIIDAFSNLHHQFHNVNERKVEEGIKQFIETNTTDILAMVAHKHNLIERLFGKVHTQTMSFQTKIPLLVLPDK